MMTAGETYSAGVLHYERHDACSDAADETAYCDENSDDAVGGNYQS